MWFQRLKENWSASLVAKFAGVLLLFSFVVIIVACGSGTSQVNFGTPVPTITISLGQFSGSPTPPLQGDYCGGWATNTTTPFSATGTVNVYGKFTQTDKNNNPVGVDNAQAVATIYWPDNTTQQITEYTQSDGIAVFTIPLQASAIDHIVLIQITFTKGTLSCSIPQAAFFTALEVSPTPTGSVVPSPTSSPSPTGTNTATPTVTPSLTPSPQPTLPSTTPTTGPSPQPTG